MPHPKHQASAADLTFRERFEACAVPAGDFDHVAHLRLAYVYLLESDPAAAARRMRAALLAFLAHLGVGESKYHETMTRAWLLLADQAMRHSAPCADAAALLTACPSLLDRKALERHYHAATLASPAARSGFVTPDRLPIN